MLKLSHTYVLAKLYMSIDKTGMLADGTKYIGNTTALGAIATWVANKTGLSIQDWVTIAVGLSAILSYLTSMICTIIKTKKEVKNPD